MTDAVFSKKPFKLYKPYAINTGYQLVLLFGDGDDSGGLGELDANAPSLRDSAGTP